MTRQVVYIATCDRCGFEARTKHEHEHAAGWRMEGAKDLCPQCVAERAAFLSSFMEPIERPQ